MTSWEAPSYITAQAFRPGYFHIQTQSHEESAVFIAPLITSLPWSKYKTSQFPSLTCSVTIAFLFFIVRSIRDGGIPIVDSRLNQAPFRSDLYLALHNLASCAKICLFTGSPTSDCE